MEHHLAQQLREHLVDQFHRHTKDHARLAEAVKHQFSNGARGFGHLQGRWRPTLAGWHPRNHGFRPDSATAPRSANVWHAIEVPATRIAGGPPRRWFGPQAGDWPPDRRSGRDASLPGDRARAVALVEEQDVSEVDSGELLGRSKAFGQFGELQDDVEQETLQPLLALLCGHPRDDLSKGGVTGLRAMIV